MHNKKLALAVLAAFAFSTSTAFAASGDQLFKDVPSDHWAYQAVTQLAKDGILTGYGDDSFQGDKTITRYEMAQIIANARTHMPQASAPDQKIIDDLSNEFRDDLDALGVRVTRLEKKQKTVRLTGSFAQKYEKAYHPGYVDSKTGNSDNEHRTRWQKEFKLNVDATVPKSPLEFHGTFVTEMNNYQGNGFNSEEANDERWNTTGTKDDGTPNGSERTNVLRPETYYVGGPIDKTGLTGRFGAIRNGVQADFVNHAVMRGLDLKHEGQKNWFSFFTGRLDMKDDDTSSNVTVGSSDHQFSQSDIDWDGGATKIEQTADKYVQSYNIKKSSVEAAAAAVANGSASTDFVRYHAPSSNASYAALDTSKTYKVIQAATGSGDWNYDWNNPTYDYSDATYSTSGKTVSTNLNRRRTLTGATFGHQFGPRFDATVGYYGYKSAAYDEDILRIYALTLNQKIGAKGNLYGAYAHGNQDGYDDAWTAEYQFNGGDAMSAEPNHAFGYYLGYRYLAPDALVKTVYEDGAQIGQRGWEGGLLYNFCHNLQGKVNYFRGTSITNPGKDRSKIFSSLMFQF